MVDFNLNSWVLRNVQFSTAGFQTDPSMHDLSVVHKSTIFSEQELKCFRSFCIMGRSKGSRSLSRFHAKIDEQTKQNNGLPSFPMFYLCNKKYGNLVKPESNSS